MIVVLAEKPSVARELGAALGADTRKDGYLEGHGYRVTWAIGHLVGLAQPEEINPAWKAWSRDTLPMLPAEFPLVVLDKTRNQYRIVERLLRDRTTTEIIAATDAGREGELIFRYIYERTGCRVPWKRLWLSSMTPAAIRDALAHLEPGSRYDGLASAARARSLADWEVGMNLSRAYTLTQGYLCSVGRVQTPTLAMVVTRDREIQQFAAQPYLEVEASFSSDRGTYQGTYYDPPHEGLFDEHGHLRPFQPLRARLPADGQLAGEIASRAHGAIAQVAHIDRTARKTPPPKLLDLTNLQKEANRLYGLSAQTTLDAAQELYEVHKALSYPRTDSRYLSRSVAATLPQIVHAIAPLYPELVAPDSGSMPSSRYVDDGKISDHHAIIPTTQRPKGLSADAPAGRVYDLVCRHLLMMWHPDQLEAVTRVVTELRHANRGPDLYATQGTSIEAHGWTVLAVRAPRAQSADSVPKIPGGLLESAPQVVDAARVHRKLTRAPHAYSDATLLAAMEFAGRLVDDEAMRETMREFGLGTPATRAPTIETLIKRGYLVREGKALRSTPTGQALIAAVGDLVKSPELTGRWERRLRLIEQGGDSLSAFTSDIATYVRDVVTEEASKPAARPVQRSSGTAPASRGRGRRSSSKLRYKYPVTRQSSHAERGST